MKFGNLKQRISWGDVVVFMLFLITSIAVAWPIPRDFTTLLASDNLDSRHHLWVVWHIKEWLVGNQAYADLNLLYYPYGLDYRAHGMGPVMPFLALPFWKWGAVAAYNGALLLGLALTGFGMYLLARSLRFCPSVALLAGLWFLLTPIHLAGIYGHLHKVFLGLSAVALLTLHYALDRDRSPGWAVLTGFLLLLVLLHNGYQFVITAMMLAFFVLIAFVRTPSAARSHFFRRTSYLTISVLILVLPLLIWVQLATTAPLYPGGRSMQSNLFQPDLLEFFLPSGFHWYFGPQVLSFLGLHQQVETAVSLSYVAILLAILGLWRQPKKSWPWALFLLVSVLFSLGPTLKIAGEETITLPYSYLVELPGLNFMRTPGRFMLMGHIGLIIAACFGLQWLLHRKPRYRRAIVGITALLILVEGWPRPWPQEELLPVPPFYQELAADEALYGVLDLPVRPTPLAWQKAFGSFYQMYQMTHYKGIAYGYISRVPSVHPMFPCFIPEPRPPQPDILVNDRATDCLASVQNQLAFYNYRYVVWHRPQPWSPWGYEQGSLGEEESLAFLQAAFGDARPFYEDEWTRVYAVRPETNPPTFPLQMGLDDNWYEYEGELRWATSPASVFITTPEAVEASLEILPAMMFTPGGGWHVGTEGVLQITMDNREIMTAPIRGGEVTAVPLSLAAGTHRIELTLAAGNFRPSDYEATEDRRQLSFAIRELNLKTGNLDVDPQPVGEVKMGR